MERKRIAIVSNRQMIVGGAEKALLEFIKGIDKSKYAITLFTLNDKGAYLDEMPNGVNIIYTENNAKDKLLKDIRECKFIDVIVGLYHRVMIRTSKDPFKKYCHSIRTADRFAGGETFDCAIAYRMNFLDIGYVLYQIRAKKKCVIMHTIDVYLNKRDAFTDNMQKFDRIFCVSKTVEGKLLSMAPFLSGKTEVMHNLYDYDDIFKKSNEGINDFDFNCISLVTVGRLSSEKGQIMVPKVCRKLIDDGYDIKWYLVGDGPFRAELEQEIRIYGVGDSIILLGTKSNPYPYIKNCTIYVQPSFIEGYCTTTMEAKILHKPIVTTDVSGMREQLVSGENGLIVEVSAEGLYNGIKRLLDNPDLRERFVKNLKSENFDNTNELQKLYDFIES